MKAYSHLSAEERIRVDELRNREGLGVRQIALRISHGKPTVSREPRRGPWLASNENESYRPYRLKRLKTDASAAICPREPVSATSRTRTGRPSSRRSTTPP